MKKNHNGKIAFFVAAVILFMSTAASASVLFSRMLPYTGTEFVNVIPLVESSGDEKPGGMTVKYLVADKSDGSDKSDESAEASKPDHATPAPDEGSTTEPENPGDPEPIVDNDNPAAPGGSSATVNPGPSGSDDDDEPEVTDGIIDDTIPPGYVGSYTEDGWKHHPEFRMEAEVEIFKFSYDETGKVTVIGPEGNPDKLFAPGTSNLYQFTLRNPGDVALNYTLSMEAYYTGTDGLWIPIYTRVWDYTNTYLVGSPDEQVDVLELNTVDNYTAKLGAGRYAVYNLEWEWPFEREDENGDITENDIYDTMLGDLAVEKDLTLTIVIRTYAEYDEDADGPGLTKPPKTGDESQVLLFSLLCGGSFVGLCGMIFAAVKSGRKEKEKKAQ